MSELPIILLLLLAVALLARMDLIFYVVYVLAGTYALSRWWAGRSAARLCLSRRFTDHLFAGESTDVEIEIINPSWLPVPWLRYEESPPSALLAGAALRQALSLRPRGRALLRYTLVGERRGYYPVGPGRLSTGDVFGFTESGGVFAESRVLIVYPRIMPLSYVEFRSRSPLGVIKSPQQVFSDPARVVGVRDYRSGDPIRAVDWKSTARVGCLQVKKLEPAVSLTAVIFLDLRESAYSRQLRVAASEWAIVVAASLANYLVGQRQAVGLASNGLDRPTDASCWFIPPRPGRAQLMKLLEWLARVQRAETTTLADWLPNATAGLSWGTTVVMVTPTGDEATCAALHRVRRAGLNPVLVAIEPHVRFGVIEERCRRLGITAYLVADENGMRCWQTGRARQLL
jgi:uncharacterized protein (DUF58 family)